MKKRINNVINSFSGRITLLMLAGILLIAVTVSTVVLFMSRNTFKNTYAMSQEKVFEQIEKDMSNFNDQLENVIDTVDSSWAFRRFLMADSPLSNLQTFQNIYRMEKELEENKPAGLDRLNILIIGKNGESYLSRTETVTMSYDAIWESVPVKRAVNEPDVIHYMSMYDGYTATAKETSVVIVSKALYYRESRDIYAVVLITLSREQMMSLYDYYINDNNSLYLVDESDTVLVSNDLPSIGKKMENEWYGSVKDSGDGRISYGSGLDLTIEKATLPFMDCTLYGVINNESALKGLYNTSLLVAICALIGALILILCVYLTNKTTAPLSQLVGRMSKTRQEEFTEYMPVEGTIEVRQLAKTYNGMLDDIKNYISELIKIQQDKRAAEIKALQMQINPHYIYNTLASIKWMVYQGNVEKTTAMIDAFISLLRNTISNADEFITIDQEVENLNNYILINRARYGDAVQVEFYVSANCTDCLLPKLILQPFVENAFFHAFPSGMSGMIEIYMKEKEGKLEIRICDDGIGMDSDKARNVLNSDNGKEHFSGIGVHNVKERLELLYGREYGVEIKSGENKGTQVTVTLPAVRKKYE